MKTRTVTPVVSGGRKHASAGSSPAPSTEAEVWRARANRWRNHAWYALDEVRRLAGDARADEIVAQWDEIGEPADEASELRETVRYLRQVIATMATTDPSGCKAGDRG